MSECKILIRQGAIKLHANISHRASRSILPPEAVLAEEGQEEAEASEERGEAEVSEVVTDGVLDALDAGDGGAALLDGVLPGEEGGLADTGAVVFNLEELKPLVDGFVVLLGFEAGGEGVEDRISVGGSGGLNALLVGSQSASEVVASGGSAGGRDGGIGPGCLLSSGDSLARAGVGAHVLANSSVIVEVEGDVNGLVSDAGG